MTAPHLTDADLDEIASHLARCQRHGAKYVSIDDQRVESLLAMARRLREHERAWGIAETATRTEA
jgi:hypothetical protein